MHGSQNIDIWIHLKTVWLLWFHDLASSYPTWAVLWKCVYLLEWVLMWVFIDYQRDWENYPRKFERILKLLKFWGKYFKTSVLDLLHARKVSQLNLWFKYAQFPRYPEFALLIPSANPLIKILKPSDNPFSKSLILFW